MRFSVHEMSLAVRIIRRKSEATTILTPGGLVNGLTSTRFTSIRKHPTLRSPHTPEKQPNSLHSGDNFLDSRRLSMPMNQPAYHHHQADANAQPSDLRGGFLQAGALL